MNVYRSITYIYIYMYVCMYHIVTPYSNLCIAPISPPFLLGNQMLFHPCSSFSVHRKWILTFLTIILRLLQCCSQSLSLYFSPLALPWCNAGDLRSLATWQLTYDIYVFYVRFRRNKFLLGRMQMISYNENGGVEELSIFRFWLLLPNGIQDQC